MKREYIKKIVFIILSLYSLCYVLLSLLSPICSYMKEYDLSTKIFAWFVGRCHQQPTRSFWLLGFPMPICCRCFGFYLGTSFYIYYSLFFKPLLNRKCYLIMFMISLLDIILNYIFHINTGNITRFIVGILMAVIFIKILNFLFDIKRKEKENEI